MTFQALRQQTFLDCFLDTNGFAYEATYTPHGGEQRQVTVHEEGESDVTILDRQTNEVMDQIIVLCARDPNAMASDGTVRGGIDTPQIHDELLKPAARDPRQEPYTFTGEVRDEKSYKWRLVFQRRARTDQGMRSA